jgi:type VI secretion system protein VasD
LIRVIGGLWLPLLLSFGLAACSMFQKTPPAPAPPPPAPQAMPQIVLPPMQKEALPPVQVAHSIEAGADANPDISGRASPVVVRVYEMRSAVAFEAADFFSLFEREQQALGTDLIGRDEYQIRPGEQVLFARPLRPGTRVVGVAVAFRDLDKSSWRSTLALPGSSPQGLSVRVDGRSVKLSLR